MSHGRWGMSQLLFVHNPADSGAFTHDCLLSHDPLSLSLSLLIAIAFFLSSFLLSIK